jgi:hypothetical protein
VSARHHLLVLLLATGLAACSSTSDDDARSAPDPVDDGAVLVGYVAPWVEQYGADAATDCRLTLESNPPVCGGPVPIEGLDLREVPGVEQDPFGDARSEPDRWALHDTYLQVAFQPDGTVRLVDVDPGREADPPPPVTCPDPDPGAGPMPRGWARSLRGNPNVLGATGGDEAEVDVVYLDAGVVAEVCELTGVPTVIRARGEVLAG